MAPKVERRTAPWRERADQRYERVLRKWEIYLLVGSTCAGAIAAMVAGFSTLVGAYQARLSRQQLQITREQTIQSTRPFVDIVFNPQALTRKVGGDQIDLNFKYVNYGHGPALGMKTASFLLPFNVKDPPYIQMPRPDPIGDDIPPNEGYYPSLIRLDEFFRANEQRFKSGQFLPLWRVYYEYKDIYGFLYSSNECFVIGYNYDTSIVTELTPCESLGPRDQSGWFGSLRNARP